MADNNTREMESRDSSHWHPIEPSASNNPWMSLVEAHQALLQSQSEDNFNQRALDLLNQTMSMVTTHHLGPAMAQCQSSSRLEWDHLKEALSEFRHLLLNSKEMASEELVERVVHYIGPTLSPLLSADEKREELQKKCLAFVHDLSPQLNLKIGPLIKSYISRQFGVGIEDLLAEVRLPEMSLKDKAQMYSRMLNNFLGDASSISFACSNRQLLGKLLPVDLWFLTFFAFVTTRRSRGDNLLMLGCVGKSSVGKSLLFESIVLATGHQIISSSSSHSGEAGVGRFQTSSKNTVVFHDINISTLVGVDVEKVKSLARSETTVVKIHSSTSTVSPMFVFYTSNERLFRHNIPAKHSSTGLSQSFSSQVEMAGRKRASPENIEAVRARFLEMLVYKTPKQAVSDLEQCGTFERQHFILGTFDKALSLLEHYQANDFHSLYLPAYVLSGLVKNHAFMESVMCGECSSNHQQRLDQLKEKFNVTVT